MKSKDFFYKFIVVAIALVCNVQVAHGWVNLYGSILKYYTQLPHFYSKYQYNSLSWYADPGYGDARFYGPQGSTISDVTKEDLKGLPLEDVLIIGSSLSDYKRYRVVEICDNAFKDCKCSSGDGYIEIPRYVTRIGNGAYSGCTGFSSIKISQNNSVTEIGYNAFYGCSDLKENPVNSMKNLTTIGSFAFADCSSLQDLTLPEGLKKIEQGTFSGCTGLVSKLILPQSLEEIGHSAFENCKFTGTLELPLGLKSIGMNAFNGCSGFIGSIEIPDGVIVNTQAFKDCHGICGSITIGDDARIWNMVFDNLGEISSVIAKGETPAIIGDRVFSQEILDNATLYIPEGSLEAYSKATGWKDFKHISQNPFIAVDSIKVQSGAFEASSNTDTCPSLAVEMGTTRVLSTRFYPDNATDKTVTYVCSNPEICTVTDGTITPLKEGIAHITAVSGKITAEFYLRVGKPVTDISMPESITVEKGSKTYFDIQIMPQDAIMPNLDVQTNDDSICKITKEQYSSLCKVCVEGLQVGSALISATAKDGSGVSEICSVVVDSGDGISDITIDDDANVKIYNLQGLLIYEGVYSDAKLASGIYIINSNGQQIKRQI